MFLNLSPPDNGTVFDVCPPGSMMVDGVCIGDPSTYGPAVLPTPVTPKPPVLATKDFSVPVDETGRPTSGNTGISPLLILAVAAAFFFAG